jgi:hypothetical protein
VILPGGQDIGLGKVSISMIIVDWKNIARIYVLKSGN